MQTISAAQVMRAKNAEQLRVWIVSRATLADVERAERVGIVGNERFSERARDWFRFVWTWSAPRFTGRAGQLQERYFARCGYAALLRRFERVRAIAARLVQLG